MRVGFQIVTGPQDIPHAQQQEAATISFNLPPGFPLGIATKAIEAKANALIPAGVTGSFTGDALEFKKSIASLGLLLLVAIFLKYIVLGILYESYIHPFTILTTLPVAVFGGLLTLWACNRELSIYAYIGLFVLIGVITKNGIMMLDFALVNQREENLKPFDAMYEAALVRFRPIMMTTMAALMGTLPIALGVGAGSESRRPLGLAVVGGLIVSQMLTLYITPVFYTYMEAFAGLFRRKKALAVPPPMEEAPTPEG